MSEVAVYEEHPTFNNGDAKESNTEGHIAQCMYPCWGI